MYQILMCNHHKTSVAYSKERLFLTHAQGPVELGRCCAVILLAPAGRRM